MLKNKKIELEPRKGAPLLLPGVIIAFIVISGLLLIKPKLQETMKLNEESKLNEEKLIQLTTKASQLERLNLQEYAQKAESLAKALPAEENFPLVISVVKILAKKVGVEIISLEVNSSGGEANSVATQSGSRFNLLSLKIVLKCSVSQFKEFIKEIRNVAPIISLNIALIRREGSDTFSVDLAMDSYFLFLPTTLGPSEKSLIEVTAEEEEIYQQINSLGTVIEESEIATVPAGKENPFAF